MIMVFNDDLSRDLYSRKYYKIDSANNLYVKDGERWRLLKNIGNNWVIIPTKSYNSILNVKG